MPSKSWSVPCPAHRPGSDDTLKFCTPPPAPTNRQVVSAAFTGCVTHNIEPSRATPDSEQPLPSCDCTDVSGPPLSWAGDAAVVPVAVYGQPVVCTSQMSSPTQPPSDQPAVAPPLDSCAIACAD